MESSSVMVFLTFLAGLALLLGGGNAMVRGSAAIAAQLGVPAVIVGMTVVAFGTSAPEFVIAIVGVTSGAGGVAFGNVAGANILNIAFILGVTAVIHPLAVNPTIATREIPMLLLAMLAALILSLDWVLDGTENRLSRGDGLVLCLLFCVFLYYTFMSLRQNKKDEFIVESRRVGWKLRAKALSLPVGLIIAGLIGLGVGGNWLVDSAVNIAAQWGMTPAAIGLTIVAIGTTLPELTTSILAARKGEADLAIGNVVGSNIFNILLILGVASSISPLGVPTRGPLSLALGLSLTVMLLFLVYLGKLEIRRFQGFVLLTIFMAYMVWVFVA